MSILRSLGATCGAALRLFGVLAVVLALQIPHFGVALADDAHKQATTAHARTHAAMGHGDATQKGLDPILCAMVCAGCVASWLPPLDWPGETVTRVVWSGSVDLLLSLSNPDPALRPPRTLYIA